MKNYFQINQNLSRESWELILNIWKYPYFKTWQKNSYSLIGKIWWFLSLYDIYFDKRYSIDDEDIHFVKGYGYALICNPYHPYETSTDHEYFCIHDDLFDRILETDQNSDIILKAIQKEPSFSSINDNSTYSISNLRSRSEMVSPCYQL